MSAAAGPDEYLSLIFNNAVNMMALFRVEAGPVFRLVSINRAYLEVVRSAGYPLKLTDLIGKALDELFVNVFRFGPDDVAWHVGKYHAVLAAPEPIRYEEIHETPQGRYFGETTLSPIRAPGGPCAFVLFSSHDVTQRRRTEEALQASQTRLKLSEHKLQESQKLESLGVLAGGIAHDFNNILTGILGNASLASLELPEKSPVHANLEAITEGSRRAADLCKQMLAYAGKGHFVLRNHSLNRLIEETTHLLQISISKKAVLRFHLDPALPAVKADGTQLRQVIMNLVINASEAIGDQGGVINLITGVAKVERGYFGTTILAPDLPAGAYVYLEVADSGCGMNAETQAKIFDPFFTTKFTGRGLGLAAVLGIVRGHGGALRLHSEPGRGTTFRMLFPVSDTAENAVAAAGGTTTSWRGQGCVLVADDEPPVRDAAAAMLGALGFTVELAADGSEAVEIFRREPDRFTLVLMDLAMPHLDGRQAFAELRRIRNQQRVVLMSGFDEQEAVAQFVGKGLASFLQKPFAHEDLRAVVQRVLAGA